MTESDKRKLEEIARAFDAYERKAAENEKVARFLSHAAVPGGRTMREFVMMACGLSSRYPPTYE